MLTLRKQPNLILFVSSRRSVDAIVVGPNVVGFTPPPIAGRIPLTTPPGVPSPSPPPSVIGAVVQSGMNSIFLR